MASNPVSPVTGIIEENQVILDFGQHEGKSIQEIAQIDPDFYNLLISQRETGAFAIRRHRDKTFRLYMNPMSNVDS